MVGSCAAVDIGQVVITEAAFRLPCGPGYGYGESWPARARVA
jgi:hypothetical protein